MEGDAPPSEKARGDAGSCLTAFALRLATRLAEGDDGREKNLVFSPMSIYAALGLVAAGARGGTLDEFLALLGAASRDELAGYVRRVAERALADRSRSGGPLVSYACGVWHDEAVALEPAFREVAVGSYMAETHVADFKNKAEKARKEINSWVSKATKKLITSILPEGTLHSRTALVLLNAIYFKGKWSTPFSKRDTEDRRFFRHDGSYVLVPFMSSRKDQFVQEYDGFKVLKLPYRNSFYDEEFDVQDDFGELSRRFSMVIFLPESTKGLPSLVRKTASRPGMLGDCIPRECVEVGRFQLPKFKLSFSSDIKGFLQDMGLKAAFDRRVADLSDMVAEPEVAVEQVFHNATIEVNEEGTEAAASTAITMGYDCEVIREPVDFVADHPFAFFVVEEVTGAAVFMGHVFDPYYQISC
ncbi:unnamed protein product [Urochloa humidicola]